MKLSPEKMGKSIRIRSETNYCSFIPLRAILGHVIWDVVNPNGAALSNVALVREGAQCVCTF